MGYEVWGRAPGEGRAQAALVRPRATGGLLGTTEYIHDRGRETGAEGNRRGQGTR